MIISRTPLRMSFTGGGSDLPGFYRRHGGAVISTSIDKYVYVTVNKKFDDGIRIAYSKNEEVAHVREIEHRLARAALEFLGISGGIEITTIADVPSKGTGLGSSSSFTVGLLHVLNAFLGRYVSGERLAADSCHIELERCQEPIGKQDQYAAACGGFNLIEFRPDDSVLVSPIICQPETLRRIERNTLVFYTGMLRSASQILAQQSKAVAESRDKQEVMRRMVRLTYDLRQELQQNNADALGDILHESWMLKRGITSAVSSPEIDQWYEAARQAGAVGGKILGAGGGGFLVFYVPEARQEAVRQALRGLRPMDIRFEPLGSRIIFYH